MTRPERTDKELASIVNDLQALPEPGMRVPALCARLKELSPTQIARLFFNLLKSTRKENKARMVLALIVDPKVIKERLGTELFTGVEAAALKLGFHRVSRLFTDLEPKIKGLAGYDKEHEAQMESISLGERRALSKKGVKESIDLLLSDPDPMVIRNILANPRCTEREAVKIASKRPNSPEILKLVVTHERWSKRYAVKKAVALNPYSPPRVSIVLLESLLSQDLKSVIADRSLHEQVLDTAEEILAQRAVEA